MPMPCLQIERKDNGYLKSNQKIHHGSFSYTIPKFITFENDFIRTTISLCDTHQIGCSKGFGGWCLPGVRAKMKKAGLPESVTIAGKRPLLAAECWLDDACILDMDYFVKTLSGIKAKGVRPDLIGSIIAHYASKWLPDLLTDEEKLLAKVEETPESATASWMKKRFFVETLVGILPPEKDSIPCNFLLRMLRTANMVGVEPTYRAELESRISRQLHQASLKELLIPSFCHTCPTLLDVELVMRLVKKFAGINDAAKSGAALSKVAKLIDSYLAEVALDSNLTLPEFASLAAALPSHARSTDDGLYRAIDTYLKVSQKSDTQI